MANPRFTIAGFSNDPWSNPGGSYEETDEEDLALRSETTGHVYVPITTLGAGDYGTVSEYRRRSDGLLVAIKTSKQHGLQDRLLHGEAQVTAALNHPNIARAIETFSAPVWVGPNNDGDGGDTTIRKWHLVLEYCELGNLRQASELGLPLCWVFDSFFRGLVSALAHVDRLELPGRAKVHCDIKPENILLRRCRNSTGFHDGERFEVIPVLADWGSCRPSDPRGPAPVYGRGFVGYMHNTWDPTWYAGRPHWRITPALDMFRVVLLAAWLGDLAGFRGVMDFGKVTWSATENQRLHFRVSASPELKHFAFLFVKPEGEWLESGKSERRAARTQALIRGGRRMPFSANGVIPSSADVGRRFSLKQRQNRNLAALKETATNAFVLDPNGTAFRPAPGVKHAGTKIAEIAFHEALEQYDIDNPEAAFDAAHAEDIAWLDPCEHLCLGEY